MIIKELRICDLLLFTGEQSLQFPTSQDTNLVVILAPNNSGKTNIIRALKFLFYGHLSDCNEASAYRMINDLVKAKAKTGSEVCGWVEATLEREEGNLTLRRIIRVRKIGKDQWAMPEITLMHVRPKHREPLEPDDGRFEQKIRTFVPEQLFDAFYFKGEPLDGKLLGGVGAIRESLAAFLHEDGWQEAEDAAEAVRQQYTREIQKLTEKNSEYSKLLGEEEFFRSHLLKDQDRLTKKKTELDAVVAEFEVVNIRLQEIGTGGDAENLADKIRTARITLERTKKNYERSETEIARAVGSSRGVPFLLGALPAARRILAQMQEENILPADVTDRFVARVLKSSRCVCGCEHTSETRKAWERYKEKTLSLNMNRGLSDLLNAVQEEGSQSYSRLSADLNAKLKQLRADRTKFLQEIKQLEAAITEMEQRLQLSPVEEIRRSGQRLRQLSISRQQLQAEVTQLEVGIKIVQSNLKGHKDKLERAKPSGAVAAKIRTFDRGRIRAEKLRLLIRESRETLNKSFHDTLQRTVSHYYDKAAYDGTRARIMPGTLLPAIENDGHVRGNLGGGQSQLLALAYVVALARLRKNLHTQMQKLGIGCGKIDDQSFFLDSPFNNMTDHYAHAIAQFLDGNARQVILLLARQQWNLVRKIIEGDIRQAYAFEYHTLPDKIAELKQKDPKLEDFVYEYGGKKMKLINELPADVGHPYTHIRALT
jgi:DNA sulfur modification protein DndD